MKLALAARWNISSLSLSLSLSAAVAALQPQLDTDVQSDQNSRLEKEFTACTFTHTRLTISILNHIKPKGTYDVVVILEVACSGGTKEKQLEERELQSTVSPKQNKWEN